MSKRKVWGALAVLAAIYTLRAALKTASDLRRYNHILSLSNEGTVQEEFRELFVQAMKGEKQAVREWLNFLKSAPADLVRYMKIESM